MEFTRATAAASTRRSLLPASSPLVGSAPSPMMQTVDDPERQWLANQLRGLLIRDAPAVDVQVALKPHGSPAPAVKNAAPADVPAAHGPYYSFNFGAPGSSIHHEPLCSLIRPWRLAMSPGRSISLWTIDFDGYYSFSRSLGAGIGGFV